MMYTMTCDQGHEPMTWETEAMDENDAYNKFMDMEEIKSHVMEKHADMMNMSDEEKKPMVMKMIKAKETM